MKLIKDLLIPRLTLNVTNFTVRNALLIIFFDTQLGSYAEASENITGLSVKGNLVRGNSKTGKPF